MNKILAKAFLAAALMTPLCANAVGEDYDPQASLTAARGDVQNWMKYLPDNVFAAHVSIPGSHDSATGHDVTLPSSSKAQEKSIDDQLEAGIRAFDIRPGTKKIDGETVLNCNHGIATTSLTLKDAMEKFTDYLKAHPTEFLTFHFFEANVKSTSDSKTQGDFDKMMNALFNEGDFADYIVDFDPYLKVKDVRGKIIIFKRDRLAFTNIKRAGNLGGWPSDSELWEAGKHATVANASDITNSCYIKVTDVSSPDSDEKFNNEINSIKNLFNYNCTQKTPNEAALDGTYLPEWTMIFTSGEYKLAYGDQKKASGQTAYLRNATFTNPLLTQLINDAETSGPTGMVFADWVLMAKQAYNDVEYDVKGDELVTAVIENNFKYIKRYIVDDNIVKPETTEETDRFGSREYYLRNVGTGQYLSSGADWGTHAVLHPTHGIRITPIFNKRSGEYILKTTFAQNGTLNFLGDNCYVDNTAMNPLRFVEVAPGVYNITMNGTITEGDVNRNATLALTPVRTTNTYGDGATLLIENKELEADNAMQQWELLTEKELLDELTASATAENPVDVSFMIHGGKFRINDSDHNNAWTFTTFDGSTKAKMEIQTPVNVWNDKVNLCRLTVGYHSATNADKMFWTFEQTVEGLPEGLYTLSCQALVDNLPLDNEKLFSFTANDKDLRSGLYAADASSAGKMNATTALSKFRDESLNNCLVSAGDILVNDGKLHICAKKGVAETNEYSGMYLNNFELKYHGKDDTNAIEEVEEEVVNEETLVDVYSISGMKLRAGVAYGSALADLSKGLYIIIANGRTLKVMK